MTSRKRHRNAQLTLDDARKPIGRGGWRPNAGRPKGRSAVAHEMREPFSARIPQHVTLKLKPGLPRLRDECFVRLIRTQIAFAHKPDFRIIDFSVQNEHMHFITEADNELALAAGVQGLSVRISKRINRAWSRKGAFFDERYHARPLPTPSEVRNALRYVLNNARHHADERGETLPPHWLDPFSSAPWFSGWASPVETSTLPRELLALPCPTMPPSVWLLTTGWKRHGLIDFDEIPGRPAKRKKPA